jgi:hypothetical protein
MQLPIMSSGIISTTKSSTTLGTTEPSWMFSDGRHFASAILLYGSALQRHLKIQTNEPDDVECGISVYLPLEVRELDREQTAVEEPN